MKLVNFWLLLLVITGIPFFYYDLHQTRQHFNLCSSLLSLPFHRTAQILWRRVCYWFVNLLLMDMVPLIYFHTSSFTPSFEFHPIYYLHMFYCSPGYVREILENLDTYQTTQLPLYQATLLR